MSKASNMSGIHPKGPRVLIRPEEIEEISAGGILIPIQAVEKQEMAQMYGEVVEIGTHCWVGDSPWCAVGDRVIFAKYAGDLFRGNDGTQYRLLRDKDIVSTIDRITREEAVNVQAA